MTGSCSTVPLRCADGNANILSEPRKRTLPHVTWTIVLKTRALNEAKQEGDEGGGNNSGAEEDGVDLCKYLYSFNIEAV